MEYTLLNSSDKAVGRIWWDGQRVQAEPAWVQGQVSNIEVNDKNIEDGLEFFEVLPQYYRTGYLRLEKKKE